MLVREVMSRHVVTIEAEAPVQEAAVLLSDHGFTALPVVRGAGQLHGVVTESDVLRGRVRHDAWSPVQVGEPNAGLRPCRVADVMTVDVLTAYPWTDVADLVERMSGRGARSVPVVEPRHRLVGIVTRRDVLRVMTSADVGIATDVRHRLELCSGPGRWHVVVAGGVVTLADVVGRQVERYVVDRHAATVVAASVRGVVDVRVAAGRP